MLPAINTEGLCILHSKDPGKDKKVFLGELNTRILRDNYDCRYFFFPEGTSGFSRKSFKQEAYFNRAIFQGEVSFNHTNFQKLASFFETKFQGKASFDDTTFEGDANFNKAIFHGVSYFGLATFKKKASFDDSVFKAEIDFGVATFKDRVFFRGGQTGLFLGEKDTDFSEVHLEKPELVRFEKVNLSKCKFLRTPLQKVEFVDVEWASFPGSKGLYDEIGAKKNNLPLVEDLYRQLKMNYQERRNDDMAAVFDYRERMVKKKRTPFLDNPLLWFYWFLSGYSEMVRLAILWLILFVVVGAYSYWKVGFNPPEPPSFSFLHSLKVIVLPRLPEVHFKNLIGSWIEITLFVIGKIQITLLILAVRRRLKI